MKLEMDYAVTRIEGTLKGSAAMAGCVVSTGRNSVSCYRDLALGIGLLFVACCIFIGMPVEAASFDCAKASTDVEKRICADDKLSLLDEKLATSYQAALQASAEPDILRKTQRAWLRDLDVCRLSNGLYREYESRIALLNGVKQWQDGTLDLSYEYAIGRYVEYKVRNGKLIYSVPGCAKKRSELVELDPLTLKWTVLSHAKGEQHYIAHDDRYVVYNERHVGVVSPLVVKDRKSGKVVARKKLNQKFLWGKIIGDQLFGIQAGEVLYFDLSDLRIRQRHEIKFSGYGDHVVSVAEWGDKIVLGTKRKLRIFDRDWNEEDGITLPIPDRSFGAYCDPSPVTIDHDVAVLANNCGVINVYDLRRKALMYTIPRVAMFASCVIGGGVLLVVPIEIGDGTARARFYDLMSGEYLGFSSLVSDVLVLGGEKLVSARRGESGEVIISQYMVDESSLGNAKLSGLMGEALREAVAQYKETGDVYRSLELLDTQGVREYFGRTAMPPDMAMIMRQYGIWVAETMDRFSKTQEILGWAGADVNDGEVLQALRVSQAKMCFLKGESSNGNAVHLDCAKYEDLLHQMLGDFSIPGRVVSMDFGVFPEKFYFSGDSLFVAKWGCFGSSRNGDVEYVSLVKYDRNSLAKVDELNVLACDDEYQDAIESVVDLGGHLVLKIQYRWDGIRPNFAVVEKNTFSIKCIGHADNMPRYLSPSEPDLCGCVKGESPCLSAAPDAGDVIAFSAGEEPDNYGLDMPSSKRVVARTKDYAVVESGWGGNASYEFHGIGSGSRIAGSVGSINAGLLVVGNENVVVLASRDRIANSMRYVLYDIDSGERGTLFSVSLKGVDWPRTVTYGDWLIVGLGRDLLVYDVKRRRFVAYDRDFVAEGFKNNGHGLDVNSINRFYIDGERLIVLTRNGKHSRIVEMGALSEVAEAILN